MSQSLQVVTSGLFLSQMCVDTHISGRPRQALVLPVWNVFVSIGIDVLFGQAEVHDVYDFVLFGGCAANQEVLRFDVSIDQMLGVDVLHHMQELDGDQQDRPQGEFSATDIKKVLEAGA